jgi:hypothetical protein
VGGEEEEEEDGGQRIKGFSIVVKAIGPRLKNQFNIT